jgi:hypothetical protein
MTKQEIWQELARIDWAQDFIREITKEFPIKKIMLVNEGEVFVYKSESL